MENVADNSSLPDYQSPPVVETILGVQFNRLSGFTNAHLGAFWKTLDLREWPATADAPPLQLHFERFSESAKWAKVDEAITLTPDVMSRLQIKNRDADRLMQLQNGRLHFNWLGGSEGRYPRYQSVRDGFSEALQQFGEFVKSEQLGEIEPNQWEVTYLNNIQKGDLWNAPSDWNFFSPLARMPSIEGVSRAESFSGGWHFTIPEKRGRLHIEWKHAIRPASEVQEVIVLAFTARGPILAGENRSKFKGILDGLDLGRETIVRTFAALMSDEANQHWGLEHGDD